VRIALALIVKADEKEAKLLDRCLENVSPYVDGIYLLFSNKDGSEVKSCSKVAKKYRATHRFVQWQDDFAWARNENFAMVPEGFDYIMWCDADDVWEGLDKLRDTIESSQADAYAFWYKYDFDEYGQPIVAHKKTMIVRPDAARWVGTIHEDLLPNRDLDVRFVEGVERVHLSSDERAAENMERNLRIAQKALADNPSDPRNLWNVANSLAGSGKHMEAIEYFTRFLVDSNSEDEKYLARMRVAGCFADLGDREKAIEHMHIAIGSMPEFPDAMLDLGKLYYNWGNFKQAKRYLLGGLKREPSYHSMIVFNPRDYDYNPLLLLSNCYFALNEPAMAIPPLKACMEINPKNDRLKIMLKALEDQKAKDDAIAEKIKPLIGTTDKEKIKEVIDGLPPEQRSHPAVCALYNSVFIKQESSGKDLVIYCGYTTHEWGPIMFKTKGVGGSEESVIHLSKHLHKMGWNVTVYANIGREEIVEDGVVWKPFWAYNARDKQDVTILWRSPKLVDYDLNSERIIVDLHDVIEPGEFTAERLAKIDRILVKTHYHRSLFPNVPDEKFAVIPNGHTISVPEKIQKEQYLMVNTSSPERSLDTLPQMFYRVKEQVPEARLIWAYGWEIYDNAHSDNPKMMELKERIVSEMERAGVEVVGRLSQAEVAKLYHRANVLAYPTVFAEIDCISVKKAQSGGAIPVTTDYGALDESNKFGVKVPVDRSKMYEGPFGVKDVKAQDEWVKAVVKILKSPIDDRSEMRAWADTAFTWESIAERYNKVIA
jgi:glycosyltransferase involved in cell wall biosynthesis